MLSTSFCIDVTFPDGAGFILAGCVDVAGLFEAAGFFMLDAGFFNTAAGFFMTFITGGACLLAGLHGAFAPSYGMSKSGPSAQSSGNSKSGPSAASFLLICVGSDSGSDGISKWEIICGAGTWHAMRVQV
jgi:hypothetical protein